MPAATSEDAIYQKSLLVHNHSNLFTGLAEVKNVQRSPNSVRTRIIQHSTNLGDPKHSELYNWFNIIRCLDWWINIEYNNTSSFIHMHDWQFPQIKYIFGTFSVVKTREIKVACTSRQSNTTSEIYNETGKHVWKVGFFFFCTVFYQSTQLPFSPRLQDNHNHQDNNVERYRCTVNTKSSMQCMQLAIVDVMSPVSRHCKNFYCFLCDSINSSEFFLFSMKPALKER